MAEIVDFAQFSSHEEALKAWLDLSLCVKVSVNMPSIPPPPPPLFPQEPVPQPIVEEFPPAHARRNPNQGHAEGEEQVIEPPYRWATDRCATVHTLEYLTANGVTAIEGQVECRRCERREVVAYDLMDKFREVERFVRGRLDTMHERAPAEWMNPVFAECGACNQPNCMRPVLPERTLDFNWLFLFLGQSLGICTLNQLKWFCKHTQNHRTGAKDRVLYLAYMTIGNQLDPAGLFQGASDYRQIL